MSPPLVPVESPIPRPLRLEELADGERVWIVWPAAPGVSPLSPQRATFTRPRHDETAVMVPAFRHETEAWAFYEGAVVEWVRSIVHRKRDNRDGDPLPAGTPVAYDAAHVVAMGWVK